MMIVISHVALTFSSGHPDVLNFFHISQPGDYFANFKLPQTNIQYLTIALFCHFGALGNNIFFICSAWFLLDSRDFKGKKIIQMMADVWLISMAFLLVFHFFGFSFNTRQLIKSFLPNTFASNWYITFYIIFYAIHPYLNKIINGISQTRLLITALLASFFFLGLRTVKPNMLFGSELMTYIVIYFDIAYVKRYLPILSSKLKLNIGTLIFSLAVLIGLVAATNYLGFRSTILSNKLLHWYTNQNIFIVLASFSLFNIFRHKIFINHYINYISGLTLFIYIIHENILVREILRPLVFVWIKDHYGYGHIVLWVLLFALALFAITTLLSTIYKASVEKVTKRIAGRIYAFVMSHYEVVLRKILILK